MVMRLRFLLLCLLVNNALPGTAQTNAPVSYDAVEALLSQHCLECHDAKDPEGGLALTSQEAMLKGGEAGPALVIGNSTNSLLIKAVEGRFEKQGKTKIMPPGKKAKLSPQDIQLLKTWIDTGASFTRSGKRPELVVPHVPPRSTPRRSIQAIASAPNGTRIAVARYAEVEIRATDTQATLRTLQGHHGNVNAVAFSKDGARLVSVAGQPGVSGEIRIWDPSNGNLVQSITGHRDAIYSVDISPDGNLIATGSYDQEIHLWRLADGVKLQTLHGHNGAVYDLAFRPDGKVLASASGDRTLKLWDVATGKRLDTLTQSTRELYTLCWSLDGTRLYAGGIDNRIRMWRVSPQATETTNPLLESRFAHEGSILSVAMSPDGKRLASSAADRSVKLWDPVTLVEVRSLEIQPDASPGLSFTANGSQLVAGRQDGTLTHYSVAEGKAQPAKPPEIKRSLPAGVERGITTRVQWVGAQLEGVLSIRASDPLLQVKALGSASSNRLDLEITPAATLARGKYTLTAEGPGGASAPVALWVDDIPTLQETPDQGITRTNKLPVAWWGSLEKPGDTDALEFQAEANQSLVVEVSTRELGSPLTPRVDILSAQGLLLQSEKSLDGGELLLHVTIPKSGVYRLVLKDDALGGSDTHHYRVRIGTFPYVVAVYPPAVSVGKTQAVELIGFNLPAGAHVDVTPKEAGDLTVPIDAEQFHTRKPLQLLVLEGAQVKELEPNGSPAEATALPLPSDASGRIASETDVDYFSFEGKPGQTLVLETDAARKGSPVDTRLEVLFPDGSPVPRTRLQAVRNTAINFRSVDANGLGMRLDHYEEMELNEYLYLNGDVMKLFRMPQGPDSDMLMYASNGKRQAFFGTTATAHALDETGFIVIPHPPEDRQISNGLPSFLVNYENDDDGERRLGSDSKLLFNPPRSGRYLVRVSDSIGRGGPRFTYRLTLREAHPDFSISLEGMNPTVFAGSGQSFTLRANRMDGYDGPIQIDVSGLPPGFTVSSPLTIEAGSDSASGVLFASPQASKPDATQSVSSRITARAEIEGRFSAQSVTPFGKISLAEGSPKLSVSLTAYVGQDLGKTNVTTPGTEIEVEPGQTVGAWLSVQRQGHDDTITFDVSNLPHGVIVDNLGLNGITFLKEESARQIFITAARWVQPMERPFHATTGQAGRQTSKPAMLKIRPHPKQAANSN